MKSFTAIPLLAAGTLVASACTEAFAVSLPAPARCTIAKLKASSSAFQCALKESSKSATGGSGDVGRCAGKLASKFASAESRGECPTTGDASVASMRAENAALAVMDLLGASIATSSDELACLRQKAKLAVKHARCQTAALSTRLSNSYIGERNDFDICRDAHAEDSSDVETDYACAVVGEAESVREASSAGFAYAPGGVWGFRLDEAPLAGAYLVGGDFSYGTLAGAHLRGANLSQSTLVGVQTGGYYGGPADLRDVDFSGATFDYVRCEGCLLGGANLATATINGIHVSDLANARRAFLRRGSASPARFWARTRRSTGSIFRDSI